MKVGFLFNPRATWIGVHYSKRNKRVCINPFFCLTVWFTAKGGNKPHPDAGFISIGG